ncbi:uncharacterized protein LOC5505284 isoform X2 [Nematostella vectensis]|uniref:uncharacterized protein LOC5505284 isoform X1 n=1 Tax=Nematostella vectensis TaxID=45351 RepID=UPI00207734FA|nr:uncharacterized protein LOC5505284 isoform X1 [Nematostella vectensis]XP_048581358.1 uncharacterized protein LOC5505284 isoform X2 [Nematostella vectensis]
MTKLTLAVVCLISLAATAMAIRCRLCWPAMDREECRRNEKYRNCDEFKDIYVDSCIEVNYHGNHTMVRGCYSGWQCAGAREECRRRGPCEVKCCQKNFCNTAGKISLSTLLIATIAAATTAFVNWK